MILLAILRCHIVTGKLRDISRYYIVLRLLPLTYSHIKMHYYELLDLGIFPAESITQSHQFA
jgi:hypothetical protein